MGLSYPCESFERCKTNETTLVITFETIVIIFEPFSVEFHSIAIGVLLSFWSTTNIAAQFEENHNKTQCALSGSCGSFQENSVANLPSDDQNIGKTLSQKLTKSLLLSMSLFVLLGYIATYNVLVQLHRSHW